MDRSDPNSSPAGAASTDAAKVKFKASKLKEFLKKTAAAGTTAEDGENGSGPFVHPAPLPQPPLAATPERASLIIDESSDAGSTAPAHPTASAVGPTRKKRWTLEQKVARSSSSVQDHAQSNEEDEVINRLKALTLGPPMGMPIPVQLPSPKRQISLLNQHSIDHGYQPPNQHSIDHGYQPPNVAVDCVGSPGDRSAGGTVAAWGRSRRGAGGPAGGQQPKAQAPEQAPPAPNKPLTSKEKRALQSEKDKGAHKAHLEAQAPALSQVGADAGAGGAVGVQQLGFAAGGPAGSPAGRGAGGPAGSPAGRGAGSPAGRGAGGSAGSPAGRGPGRPAGGRGSGSNYYQNSSRNCDVDRAVEGILATGGYVDPSSVWTQLVGAIEPSQLKGNERFRQLQWQHLQITAALECYFRQSSIASYLGAEQFVVETMKRIRKGSSLVTFEDVGMGGLNKHVKMVEKFGNIEHPEHLRPLDTDGVVTAVMTFNNQMRKRSGGGFLFNKDQNELNFEFNKHYASSLGGSRLLGAPQPAGVHANFVMLARNLRFGDNTKTMFANAIAKRKLALEKQLSSALTWRDQDAVVKVLSKQRTGSVNLSKVYSTFKTLLSEFSRHADPSLGNSDRDLGAFALMYKHLGSAYCDFGDAFVDIDASVFESEEKCPSRYIARFRRLPKAKVVDRIAEVCAITVLLLCVTPLKMTATVGSSADMSTLDRVRARLDNSLVVGFPKWILDLLAVFLLNVGVVIERLVDPATDMDVAVVNFVEMRDKFCELITPTKRKAGSGESSKDYFGLSLRAYVACGWTVVLYLRLMKARGSGGDSGVTSPSAVSEKITSVVRSLAPADYSHRNATGASVTAAATDEQRSVDVEASNTEAGPEVELARLLCEHVLDLLIATQDGVTTALDVPAFECAATDSSTCPGGSSFLVYISQHHQDDLLIPHLSRFLRDATPALLSPQGEGCSGSGGDMSTCYVPCSPEDQLSNMAVALAAAVEASEKLLVNWRQCCDSQDVLSVFMFIEQCVRQALGSELPFEALCGQSLLRVLTDAALHDPADLGLTLSTTETALVDLNVRWQSLFPEVLATVCEVRPSHAGTAGIGAPEEDTDDSTAEPMRYLPTSRTQFVSVATLETMLMSVFSSQSPAPFFPSEFELFRVVQEVLCSSFLVAEASEADLVSILDSLKLRGTLNIYWEGGQSGLALASAPVLVFDTSGGVTAASPVALELSDSDLARQALAMVAAAPLGVSCAEYCAWDDLFAPSCLGTDQGVESGPLVTVVDFVTNADPDELRSAGPHRQYYCYASNDCVPVTTMMPTVVEALVVLKSCDYVTLGGWCVSAACGSLDRVAFQDGVLSALFLSEFEARGARGYLRLQQLCLLITLALPIGVQVHGLRLCLDAVVVASRTSVTAVLRDVMSDLCVGVGPEQLFDCPAAGARAAKRLVALALQHEDLAAARSYVQRLLRTGFGMVARNPADNDGVCGGATIAARSEEVAVSVCGLDATPEADVTEASLSTTGDDGDRDCEGKEGAMAMKPKEAVLDLLRTDFEATRNTPAERKLQKVLEKIAGDLYSSDVHFVMELIQNADDNDYASGVEPTLSVDLYGHALVVRNNEVGFSKRNMIAVCNVSGSTKAGQAGYIGQKGIGFKSVFSVSDCPEIHSNGYHFKFNRDNMIQPIWIDENPPEVVWPTHGQFNTIIRLNLDDAAKLNFARLNANLEEAFDAKLLLFLNKLRHMKLQDRCRGKLRSTEHVRSHLSTNWVKINSSFENHPERGEPTTASISDGWDVDTGVGTEAFWFIRRKSFSPAVLRSGVAVERTDVAVAFHFSVLKVRRNNAAVSVRTEGATEDTADDQEEGMYDAVAAVPELLYELQLESSHVLPVYAFLPTKANFFRFVMQGDFVLSSSREALQEGDLQPGHAWNKHLIEQTAGLFVESVVEMFQHCWASLLDQPVAEADKGTGFDSLDPGIFTVKLKVHQILALLPRRSILVDSSPLCALFIDRVYSELKMLPIFRSQDGDAVLPSQTFTMHHLDFNPHDHDLVSEADLRAGTGRIFVHDSLELDDELADLLGVKCFSASDAVMCLENAKVIADKETGGRIDSSVLSGGLLLIAKLFGTGAAAPARASTAVSHTSRMTPSQVLLRPTAQTFKPSKPHAKLPGVMSRIERSAVVSRLRALELWPLADGRVVSLNATTVLIDREESSSLTPQQAFCLKEFQALLPLLDRSILQSASRLQSSGANVLCSFMLLNLCASKAVAGISTGSKGGTASRYGGGCLELTSGSVISGCIAPLYGDREKLLDRRTAAALIAFMFHGTRDRSGKADYTALDAMLGTTATASTATTTASTSGSSVVIPVCSWNNNNKGGWQFRNLVRLVCADRVVEVGAMDGAADVSINAGDENDNDSDCDGDEDTDSSDSITEIGREVHLGLEIPDAASVINFKHVSTVLHQTSFLITDPLCAAFASGNAAVVARYDPPAGKRYHADPSLMKQALLPSWKEFLGKLGVVNLFGLRRLKPSSRSNAEFESPALLQFIGHLTRHGRLVPTVTNPEFHGSLADGKSIDVDDDEEGDEEVSLGIVDASSEGGGRRRSAAPHLPVFLPHPSDTLLDVSKAVFDTLWALISVMSLDLEAEAEKCGGVSKCSFNFLAKLNELPWFPAYLHGVHYRAGESAGEYRFVLTSPRNIWRLEHRISNDVQAENLLGPQSLYLSKEHRWIFQDEHKGCVLSKYLQFLRVDIKGSGSNMTANYGECDGGSVLLRMYAWMATSQTGGRLALSRAVSRGMLTDLHRLVEQERDQQGPVHTAVSRILRGPSVWFPDAKLAGQMADEHGEASDAGAGNVAQGTFVSTNSLVQKDLTDQFAKISDRGGPLRVMSDYYTEHDRSFLSLLGRRVCKVCSTYEGMFGARGGSLLETERRCFGQVMCSCRDIGFGALLPTGGVVKSSPEMGDILALIDFYRDYLNTECVKGDGGQETLTRSLVKGILCELGMNLWKCFHIPLSIHPYSAESVRAMIAGFSERKLLVGMNGDFVRLPTVVDNGDGSSSVSVGSPIVIAVDDADVWGYFKEQLLVLAPADSSPHTGDESVEAVSVSDGGYLWVDAVSGASAGADDLGSVVEINRCYDVDELERDTRTLLSLSSAEFFTHTDQPPLKTFIAPRSISCLMRVLAVPLLTDYVTTTWTCVPVEPSGRQTGQQGVRPFLAIVNFLLQVAQQFIHGRQADPALVSGLGDSEGVRRLLSVNVVACSSIQRDLRVHIDGIDAEHTAKLSHRVDRNSTSGANTVYLCCDELTKTERVGLATQLVMGTVQTAVAERNRKREYDLMKELRACLTKYAAVDGVSVQMVVAAERLDDVPLPEGMKLWTLTTSEETTEEEGVDQDDGEPVIEAPGPEAQARIDNYRRVTAEHQERERKRAQSAQPASDRSAEKFVNPDVSQLLETSRLRDTELARAQESNPTTGESLVVPGPISGVGDKELPPLVLGARRAAAVAGAGDDNPMPYCGRITFSDGNSDSTGTGTGMGAGTGTNTGTGTFDPNFARPAEARGGSGAVLDMQLMLRGRGATATDGEGQPDGNPAAQCSETQLQELDDLLRVSLTSDGAADHLDGVGEIAAVTLLQGGHSRSGRFGERLVTDHLRRLLIGSSGGGSDSGEDILVHPALTAALGGASVESVVWANEEIEAGLPYDIVVTLAGQDPRYCEVKTRVVKHPMTADQWAISLAELNFAIRNGSQFFTCVLCIGVDEATGRIASFAEKLIGLENGLVSAIDEKRAHLLLQSRN